MTVANSTFGIALAVALISQHLWAQPAPAATKLSSKGSIETFYLTTPSQQDGANELAVAVRNILPPDAKIFFVPNQNAFTVLGTPEELVLARQIISDLDRPKRTYRLAYTVIETDNGKRIGTQHYSMVVATGQRAILRQGSKVPIAMESYIAGSSPAQRQISYIAVGTNFDASLDESANGVRLRTKVERLSVAEERSGMSSQPVMRQISLEGTSFAILGKRLNLGSMDIPSSTKHLDIEVVIEAVR
jgi:hypothetical protein